MSMDLDTATDDGNPSRAVELAGFPADLTGQLSGPDLLDALRPKLAEYLDAKGKANTKRTYASGWKVWLRFCDGLKQHRYTADEDLLAMFVVWLIETQTTAQGKRLAPKTVEGRLTAAVRGLRAELGIMAVPKGIGGKANEAIKAYAAGEGATMGRGKAPALWPEDVHKVVEVLRRERTLQARRDEAMLLVMYATAMRRSEVAALHYSDVRHDPDGRGLTLRVRDSKTGARSPSIPYETTDPEFCAVLAWDRWVGASQIDRLAERLGDRVAAFPQIGKRTQREEQEGAPLASAEPITGDYVGDRLTAMCAAAGLTVHITAHSSRRGHASAARRAGRDLTAISRQGGWVPGSRALHLYLDAEDDWIDNSAAGLLARR